ncbi:TPA: hypothetical protein ACLBZX_005136 [Bacillus cereus]|uniref:hypothetical protein n=1 Tax=unclassified Bacillus cereus group TaxID=2750818 RepID=UPI000BA29E69
MMNLSYTYHAIKEMREELEKDNGYEATSFTDEQVKKIISECMQKATFISKIMGTNQKVDRLFAYRRYCFVLDLNKDVVITVYRREFAAEELRELVRPFLFERLAEMHEVEEELEQQRVAADMAYLMTQKINAKMGGGACFESQVREAIVREELKTVTRQLYHFRLEKSKIAKGIALFI